VKRILLLVAVFIFAMPVTNFAKLRTAENYVAIGDSLAAGQTPNREIDTGYTDLIAMRLRQTGQLTFYTKQLAFPGYTVDDVLKRVQREEAASLLSKATLITISAGANDLLRLVQVNMNAGTLTYSQLATDYALNNARKKMGVLLDELKTHAPNAKVYVVGYYFAYPYAHETQKQGTKAQLELLNAILKQEAESAGATFVPVYEAFGLDAKALLPNPLDVHPNMDGYRVMANAFLEKYTGSTALAISVGELPAPNPVTFEQLVQMQKTMKPKEKPVNRMSIVPTKRSIQEYVYKFGYMRELS